MAKYRKLGRTSSQRKALIRSQVTALFHNGRIITTEARAKEVRKVAEGLIAAAVKECDNFEEVVAACPVPIVVAGGKKLPEDEALTLAYRSIQGGAKGLDMGRNIFQSNHPVEMSAAIRKIVHEGFTDKEAYEFYQDAIH